MQSFFGNHSAGWLKCDPTGARSRNFLKRRCIFAGRIGQVEPLGCRFDVGQTRAELRCNSYAARPHKQLEIISVE